MELEILNFSTITFYLFVYPLFLHLLTVLSGSAPLFNKLPSAYSAILILDLFVSCNSHDLAVFKQKRLVVRG